MSQKPEISVCVPVYNVAPYLQQCIDSLMSQTVGVETEYIFVNDASTDESGEILRRNQAAYPDKIRVLEHAENQGIGSVRNTAIQAAKGFYVGFVDSDDFVSPFMFETLYRNATETGADVAFIQYASVEADTQYNRKKLEAVGGGTTPDFSWQHILRWHNRELTDEGRMDLLCYAGMSMSCGLWKKSVWDKNNLKFVPKLRYEDNYFVSLALCYVNKVAFVPEALYFYRKNPNSTVHAKNAPHQFDRIQIERELLAEVKRRNLFERYYPAWEYIYAFRYAFNTCTTFLNTYENPPVDVMREVCADLKNTFPDWRKNAYYQAITPQKRRLRNELLYRFPGACVKLFTLRRALSQAPKKKSR